MNEGVGVAGDPKQLARSADLAAESRLRSPRGESSIPVRALYDVPEAMALLNLSRTQIYELIRSRRLVTVTQGRGGWYRLTRSRYAQLLCGRRAVMMVARRSRGEGSLFWNEKRQRWIGIVSQGYAANGKRRTTWVSGRTKTEAKTKLREAQRARDDGLPAGRRDYTVRQAVESWLSMVWRGGSQHSKEPDDLGSAACAAGLGSLVGWRN